MSFGWPWSKIGQSSWIVNVGTMGDMLTTIPCTCTHGQSASCRRGLVMLMSSATDRFEPRQTTEQRRNGGLVYIKRLTGCTVQLSCSSTHERQNVMQTGRPSSVQQAATIPRASLQAPASGATVRHAHFCGTKRWLRYACTSDH